ncbi:SNARE associated Golgi protein family protein [Tanacetum coccineum]
MPELSQFAFNDIRRILRKKLNPVLLFRLLFRSSTSATQWAHGNKYFHVLSRGVERDGWKFVLLARFSPIPSYIINYALAATNVRFLRDFLVPTVLGCLPMILQNTSIGSLAGAAVASSTGSESNKSKIWSYVFPMMGITSSIIISLRIKKYSSSIAIDDKPEEKTG